MLTRYFHRKREISARSTRIRLIAALAATCALMLGAVSSASAADAVAIANVSCHGSRSVQIDGKCMQIAQTKPLGSKARAAFRKAFASPGGRAALQKALRAFMQAKVGLVQASPAHVHPDWNCPGGTSCGVSGSGGTHFWVIASYASIYNVGAFPFWLACTGALSPVIDPLAATIACAAVTATLWGLVNNAPYTTRHGIWMAIYKNHISDGYW